MKCKAKKDCLYLELLINFKEKILFSNLKKLQEDAGKNEKRIKLKRK